MKKIIWVALVATFMVSCSNKPDGYVIEGTVQSLADGTEIFIEVQDPSQVGMVVSIDTAVVNNGKFKFEGKIDEIQLAYLGLGNTIGKIPFVLENDKIVITAFTDSIQKSTVGGSYNNKELFGFNAKFTEYQKKIAAYRNENLDALMKARQFNDTVAMNKINDAFKKMEKEFDDYIENYISKNNNSFVTLVLLSNRIKTPTAEYEKIKPQMDNLSPELKSTKIGKKLLEELNELSYGSVGQQAPDFSAPNPEGNTISLKESMGKVTIIDFWASWCGPCRIENPNMVALYDEFHSKGLNVIGVSLDRAEKKDEWIEAIATDKLAWPQVSNLMFWQDPIARKYNVKAIPATFILDEKGVIVAKNLKGEELRNKVAEMLK